MQRSPYCTYPECGRAATDNHHRESRGVAPDRVVDQANFVSLCVEHHLHITDNPDIGYELGLMERSSYELRRQSRLES